MASPGLELRVRTPAGWASEALRDPERLLSDHAHCEKKAAVSALNLSLALAEVPRASVLLARLAEEELNHYRRVLQILAGSTWRLLPDGGNGYANALLEAATRTGPERLLDRLLVASLIEARSCERLGLLEAAVEGRPEPGLAAWGNLLAELGRCEAGHAVAFRSLAVDRFGAVAERRMEAWLEIEARVIEACPWRPAIH